MNGIKKIFEKLNRIKDKVQSNPKQGFKWVSEGDIECNYEITNIKNLTEHEDNIEELIIWLWNLKDYIKEELKKLNIPIDGFEERINQDSAITIIADLANTLKHGTIWKSRSGMNPKMDCATITINQGDIEELIFLENQVIVNVNKNSGCMPERYVVTKDGTKIKALDLCLRAIDGWKLILNEYNENEVG